MKTISNSNLILERAGLKKTAFREELLKILAEASTSLPAAKILEILAKTKRRHKRRQSFDRATLFRNLKTLVQHNILNATDFGTGSTYYCLLSDDRHHHHIFCARCHSVRPLEICAIGPGVEHARALGYEVSGHRLELFGVCPNC